MEWSGSTTLVPVWLRQKAEERWCADVGEECFRGESREERGKKSPFLLGAKEKSTCIQNFPNPQESECKVFLESANEGLAQGLVTLPQRRKFKPKTALTDINVCTQTLVGSLCIYWIRQNEIGSCPASSASVPKKRGKTLQQHNPIELNFYCLAADSNPAHKIWTLRDALQPCSCGWAAAAVPPRSLRPNQI